MPDSAECYSLDLNYDGIYDFDICIIYYWSNLFPENRVVNIQSIGNENHVIARIDTIHLCQALQLGDSINLNSLWRFAGSFCSEANTQNFHCPMDEFYVGLKIKNSNNYYYGWVRLHTTLEELTIKDYAYNSIANQPILAGQMSLNAPDININSIDFAYRSNILTVDFNNNLNPNGMLTITNTLGNLVNNVPIDKTHTEINISNYISGFYIVNLYTSYGTLLKKIFKL